MGITVVTPPAALVTAADAKVWAPVLADDADARVNALLAASQAAIERSWVGRSFGAQTLRLTLDRFPWSGFCSAWREVELPYPPVRQVNSVGYVDRFGDDQSFATGWALRWRGETPVVRLNTGYSWPETNRDGSAVMIEYDAGYASDDPQLLPVKQAVVLGATRLRSLSTQDLTLSSETVDGVGAQQWTVSPTSAQLVAAVVADLLAPYRVYSL